MKAFEDMTYLGRIRRIRQAARDALQTYDLKNPQLKFLRQAGNTLFRVNESNPNPLDTDQANLFTPGMYLLRIHEPGYQTAEGIALELAWLSAMRREGDLPVPEPVPARDGRLCTQVAVPGKAVDQTCSLLRWLKGRELKREEIQPSHYQTLGQLTARLHQFAARWQPPADLTKRCYDWNGLFMKEGENGTLSDEAWSLLPRETFEPFRVVADRMKQVMQRWGKGPEVYGLIHGDLGMGANVLFWNGEARLIDFDDSGFGYYLFDLSIILKDSQNHQIQPQFREALLEGYTRVRLLSEEQLRNLDLFLAAYAVFWSLYAVDVVRYHPEDREEIFARIARYFRLVEHHLAHS